MKILQIMVVTAVIGLWAAVTIPQVQAADVPAAWTWPLLSTVTVSNGVLNRASSGTSMAIDPTKDLNILVDVNGGTAVASNSTYTVGFNLTGFGPTGTNATTDRPIQCQGNLFGSTNVVQRFFISRTNFYGASGMRLDQLETGDSTNATFNNIYGNQVK